VRCRVLTGTVVKDIWLLLMRKRTALPLVMLFAIPATAHADDRTLANTMIGLLALVVILAILFLVLRELFC